MGVLTRWLYFRLFGASALCAVVAVWAQLPGLVGSDGLWPAAESMAWTRENVSFWAQPHLGWLSASDAMLHALCAACVACALLLMAGVATRWALGAFFVCWLTLCRLGGPFLQFQWDILLLEAAALSLPYAPGGLRPRLEAQTDPPYFARFLVFFIGFKVTFCSGLVKLMSGDPAWRDLTALGFHHWTQPLPNLASYLSAQWGDGTNRALCLAMYLVELPLPLLAFGPRPARLVAAGAMATLQVALFAAGNYSYFNLLALALCVPLLDDDALRALAPRRWALPVLAPKEWGTPRRRQVGAVVAAVIAVLGALQFLGRWTAAQPPRPVEWVLDRLESVHALNAYGAFAVMTRTRPEIVVEVSKDGAEWVPWEFKWKPGRVDVPPRQVAPWQPRLDWQMWFAALGKCAQSPWFLSLQRHLLLGTPQVKALLGEDPLRGERPLRIRSLVYQYRFAPLDLEGQWWVRELEGEYCPELVLDAGGNLVRG